MSVAVKKVISLPTALARRVEALARAEGRTLSKFIQDALQQACIERRSQELLRLQNFWSHESRDKGIRTEKSLDRYLRA